jgi:HK97 family phage portal protein
MDFESIDIPRLSQRSLESPTVSLSDPSAFDFLGIGTSPVAAGVRVDRRTILTLDGWWRGVNLIAGSIGRCPLYVFKGERRGNNTVDIPHPAYRLLFQKASEHQTANLWKECMTAHALVHGNGYSFIDRNDNGEPRQLALLAPDRTYPIRVQGVLWFITHIYTDIYGGVDGRPENKEVMGPTTMKILPPEDVFHLRGLGYDGLVGYTVFDLAGESAGHGLATRQYAARFFSNGAEPRVIIELPQGQTWKPETLQEFLREWNMMHSGVSNSHRTAILTQGATLNAYSADARASQLVEQRQFHIREIANWLGLPPHKLGDDSRTSYNSVEAENLAVYNDCYAVWMEKWCREAEDKLFTERQKESYSHFCDFDKTDLIRSDNKTEADALAVKVNNGLLNGDEARATMNLPAMPDGMGKSFRIPVNIGILTKEGVKGIQQNQGDMKRPEGTQTPADQKSKRTKRSKANRKEAEDLINDGWLEIRYGELDNLSHPEHCDCIEIQEGLHGKYLGKLNDHDVLAVPFDIAASKNFYSEMDLIVAGNHEKWKFIPTDQYWVDSGYQFGDVMHDLLHECVEEEIMRILGWEYEDAHAYANIVEDRYVERLLLEAKQKLEDFKKGHAVRMVMADATERVIARLMKDGKDRGSKEWFARHQPAVSRILAPAIGLYSVTATPSAIAEQTLGRFTDAGGDPQLFTINTILELVEA